MSDGGIGKGKFEPMSDTDICCHQQVTVVDNKERRQCEKMLERTVVSKRNKNKDYSYSKGEKGRIYETGQSVPVQYASRETVVGPDQNTVGRSWPHTIESK